VVVHQSKKMTIFHRKNFYIGNYASKGTLVRIVYGFARNAVDTD